MKSSWIAILLLLANSAAADLIPTSRAAFHVDSKYVDAIEDFEARGGVGGWVKSVSPYATEGEVSYFYFIRKLPPFSNPDSSLWAMRMDHSRRLLEAGDAHESKIQKAKAVILLPLSADKMTLAHEYRHWKDRQEELGVRLMEELKPFMTYFPTDWGQEDLMRGVLEIRGYAEQARQARWDWKRKREHLGPAGNVQKNPGLFDLEYQLEIEEAKSTYTNYILPLFIRATEAIRKNGQDYDAFKRVLSRYDFSDDPENELTFAKVLTPSGM